MNFRILALPVSLRVVAVDLQIDVKSRKISVIKKSQNSNRLSQDILWPVICIGKLEEKMERGMYYHFKL